ncbi:MAG: response regulator [Planctomycetes bacterium]|nr:response regulator [Planctomycetota bacterium]
MKFKPIKSKFFKALAIASCVTAIFVCVCFFAWLNIKNFENVMVTQIQQHLSNIAQSESQSLEEMFRNLQNKLQMLSKDPRIQQAIIDHDPSLTNYGPEGDSPSEALFEQLSVEIDNLYRLDARGFIQNRIPYKAYRVGVDFSQKPGIKYVLENHVPYISDVFTAGSGRHCMSVCSPVFQEKKLLGIIRTIIYLDNIQKMVDHIRLGKNGYAWILSHSGNIISHRNKEIVGKNIFALTGCAKNGIKPANIIFKSMTKGDCGTDTFVCSEFSTDKTIMAWAPIILGNEHWSIGVYTDYKDIASPINAHSRNIFLGIGICLCLLTATSIAYYRVSKKKTHLEAQMAISRVNDELQLTSIEREDLSRELGNSKKMLDIVISNVPLCILWKDTESVYRGCNKRFAQEVGIYDPKKLIGKTDRDFHWKRDEVETFSKLDKEVMKSGIPILNAENTATLSDGSCRTTLSNRIPLHNIKGEITGILVVYTDITETKNVQARFATESQKVHDIISSIDDGFVVVDDTGKIVEVNSYFAKLSGNETGQLKTKTLRSINNKAFGDQLQRWFESYRVDNKNWCFEYDINNRKHEVKLSSVSKDGDESLVVIQVVDISRFLDIRKDAEEALSKISHDLRTPISSITGFAELLQQEKLTEDQMEFVNTIHASSNNLLDIITKIIKEAGLDIEDSEPQHFDVDNSEEPAAEQADAEPEKPSQTKSTDVEAKDVYHILLVDDVEENRMLAEVMLKGSNYRITSCVNGLEAVEHAAKTEFDLILMDIQMPQMDGYEATRAIRTKSKNRKTAIIAMTASTAKGDELKCLEVGCDDFIYKPVTKEILLRKICRFTEQGKQLETAEKGGDITSFLAENPDYTKLIETFVGNLPGRIEEMQNSLDENNLQDLAFKIHALKGLGGFAGFPIFTEKAKNIEQMINDCQVDKIQEQIDELARLCRRTRLKGPLK